LARECLYRPVSRSRRDCDFCEEAVNFCEAGRISTSPDQLLFFEIGELEKLIEEQLQDGSKRKPKKKRKRGSRVIPDGLPEEIIDHELPEEERQCQVDGKVMPFIRWETECFHRT